MAKTKLRLISNVAQNRGAIEVAEAAMQLKVFSDEATFNPFRDYPKATTEAEMLVAEGGSVVSEPVSAAKRLNFRRGATRMPSGYVAGILQSILVHEGAETFIKCWKDYFSDYLYVGTVGRVEEVGHYLQNVVKVELPKTPERERMVMLRTLHVWQEDLKSSGKELWCTNPATYDLSGNHLVMKALRDALGIATPALTKFLKMRRKWAVQDVYKALLWCVATGVHPIKLLNFAGYWMTHKERQPESFALANPETQVHERELKSKGYSVGHELASQQFTEGFIAGLASIIQQITWYDGEDPVEYVSEEFLTVVQCMILEDFTMLGGLEWQQVPLTEKGLEYYLTMGITNENPNTIRELSSVEVSKKAQETMKLKLKHNMVKRTGNPLFDAELEDN